MNIALTSAKFFPFTIPAISINGFHGVEIKLDTVLSVILTSYQPSPFNQPEICGGYFDGQAPASGIMAFVDMRNLLADHLKYCWHVYGVLHLVSVYNGLLTRKGDNIFPGVLNITKVVFVVRPVEGGWILFVVSLDLTVAVMPKYRLILPYNPAEVAEGD